jgi:hypothetical protein
MTSDSDNRDKPPPAQKPAKKPDPIEDVREGLGLLFRAAKSAMNELPTDKLEETLKTGVREVGRAVESVAQTIEREVFGAKAKDAKSTTDEKKEDEKKDEEGQDKTEKPDEPVDRSSTNDPGKS